MPTFTAESKPADIIKIYPKASDLFKAHRIDFCCGGDKALQESFDEKGLNGEEILSTLNSTYEEWSKEDNNVVDWDQVPVPELIDHIIYHHHAYLRQELPALREFVTRVFQRHGMDQPHLRDLYRLYNEFQMEMEEHSMKEEAEVFPLIKEYVENPSTELLEKIRIDNGDIEEEHNVVGELLKKMRIITNDFEAPIHACGTYRVTYARLEELESETSQHIHLENNVLFKRL